MVLMIIEFKFKKIHKAYHVQNYYINIIIIGTYNQR